MKMNGKMKTAGKMISLSLASAMLLGLAPASAALRASAMGASEELNAQDGLLTSDLISDGGFEGLSVADGKAGAWTVDTSSEAAGGRGSASIVEDAYTGESALKLTAPGNSSGYPEISQEITVLPNTAYYLTLRLKVDGLATDNSNIFFGLASPDREGEEIYGQQHRWGSNAVDLDKVYKTDGVWNETNGFSEFSARVTTGNETNARFFLRVQKVSVIVDEISVTYEGDMVPGLKDGNNLLKNAGFEESIGSNALKDWEPLAVPESGSEFGIDKLDASTFMPGTQDKQIEGANALYIAAKSGVQEEDVISIGQGVSVQANTRYSFYANFSKWDRPQFIEGEDEKIPVGLQSVTIGIYGADKETVLAQKRLNGADVSLCRYVLAGVTGNSGENTTVYPFIKISAVGFGTYGQGLYVDDCSFFRTTLDLPEGKTNLLSNGTLEKNSDDWYEVGGSSQLGWQNKSGYVSDGSVWLSQWNPYNGLMQSVNLEAGKLYKLTAYVSTYLANDAADAPFDGLNSPVSLMVLSGNDEALYQEINTALGNWSFDGIAEKVVAKQNVYFNTDVVYRPINLIFSVETSGAYSVLVGFEGSSYVESLDAWIWRGGMNIGGVSMYETSMEELSPIKKDETYDDCIVNTDETNITLSEDTVTVKTAMSVSDFLDAVYAAPGYTMKLVNANGEEATSGNLASGYRIVVSKDGETVKTYTVTVTAQGGEDKPNPDQPKNDRTPVWVWAIVGVGAAAVVGGAVAAVLVIRKKKNK